MAKQTAVHRKPVLQLDKSTKRIMALSGNPQMAREYKKLMLAAIVAEKNFKEKKVVIKDTPDK